MTQPQPDPSQVINQSDLDQFKLEVLQKINRRFLLEDQKYEEPSKVKNDRDMTFDCDINPKGSMDKMMAGDYIERTDFEKRDRVNSGSIIKNEDTVSFSTVEEEH